MTEQPRCQECGAVMVEEFEYRRVNDLTELAIPTGKYSCLRCKKKSSVAEPRKHEGEVKP